MDPRNINRADSVKSNPTAVVTILSLAELKKKKQESTADSTRTQRGLVHFDTGRRKNASRLVAIKTNARTVARMGGRGRGERACYVNPGSESGLFRR